MSVCVLKRGLGGALGVDERWLPLPTRPQLYCDPASLVFNDDVLIQVIHFICNPTKVKFEQTIKAVMATPVHTERMEVYQLQP